MDRPVFASSNTSGQGRSGRLREARRTPILSAPVGIRNHRGNDMKRLIASVALSVFVTVGRGAEQPLAWPQFRGPGGSGVADGQKPPVEFGPDKNVKWKVPAPSGLSSPIVAGDKLVITAFDDGELYTITYNPEDGKEEWGAY